MNPHNDIESLLRSLQPGDLPAGMRARLRREPPCRGNRRHGKVARVSVFAVALAAAACVALWFKPAGGGGSGTGPVTVHHLDSELVATRKLGFVEKDGRVYQVEERRWRDAESALCSGTAVRVSLSADRHEVVYAPVSFD